MRQPEPTILGPRTICRDDVDAINRVFSDAFTDRYRRDGLVGVRVPRLNPQVWEYALQGAGDGAMLWHDEDGKILAFNIAHRSGAEGWMGPLAVRTDRQGLGLGRLVVTTAVDWLQRADTKTIGLETMPRTVDNIGFYSQLGFVPGYLTITVVADLEPGHGCDVRYTSMADLRPSDRDEIIDACARRVSRSAPGYDFGREMRLTNELSIGDTIVIGDGEIRGFALWHAAALVEARAAEEVRVLKLFADGPGTMHDLLDALEACATQMGLHRIAIRCQTNYTSTFTELVRRGYRVRWTDLRMTLVGFPAPVLPPGETLLSNWEI